ncbi:MAG: NAD kinase [Bacteroidetes bacterium]|jgi:NAD+ kinase|nr:NAD kinase [Bacteroidota bacterium]
MTAAIYARILEQAEIETFDHLVDISRGMGVGMVFHSNLGPHIKHLGRHEVPQLFSNTRELIRFKPQVFICIGGDGTMLDSLLYVKDSGIPVIGINTGRLGFLSHTTPDALAGALQQIATGAYDIEQRTVLRTDVKGKQHFTTISLNDISFHKRDTSAMLAIHAGLNGLPFNTYWADGLLVSTPTGSTAYSLSCGGPVLFPNTESLLITPVAPHNLNVRPVIVADSTTIHIRVEGRGSNFLMAFDSRNRLVDYQSTIDIQKANFKLNLIRFKEKPFINTLQEKLNWGKDNRNLGDYLQLK